LKSKEKGSRFKVQGNDFNKNAGFWILDAGKKLTNACLLLKDDR